MTTAVHLLPLNVLKVLQIYIEVNHVVLGVEVLIVVVEEVPPVLHDVLTEVGPNILKRKIKNTTKLWVENTGNTSRFVKSRQSQS